ncbi:hypothetical protein EV424DRAFT_1534813 [Suillus variegatus]|nr:hypothetical protein EV424DRAFT_1534813 [Suillus variegatus]
MESNSRPKDQALDNPVWEPLKARSKQPHKCEVSTSDKVRPVPTDRVKSGKTPSHRTKTTVTALPVKNKRDPKGCKRPLFALSDSDSEEEARMWRQSKTRKARKLESEPDSDTSKQGGVSDASKSEDSESEAEPADSIAKGLLAEIPTIAHHSSHLKKPHQRQPATASPSPEATKSLQTPPPPIWGSQLKPMNARERRQAAEVPLWDPIMTSSSFVPQGPTAPVNKTNRFFSDESILVEDEAEDEAEDDYNLTLDIKSEPHSADESEAEPHGPTKSLHRVDPMARIVYTKTGSVQLTDQNIELRNVIQRGILEVKVYIAFEHRYPDLVTKNVYTRDILLKAAQYHSVVPIEKRMRTDNEYLLALTNLIDARASLFRSEIKDVTSKNIVGYFRLGGFDCDAILDQLLTNHSYIFPQTFDAVGLPSPNRQKPYQTQPVFLILYEVFFKSSKSVGAQFSQRFCDIAKNKGGRPEIPIPMLAIVCTAICATLLAKQNKSSNDFKFTGNQFLDIYNHHVSLLGSIRNKAPIKFHKMMSDIYEEILRFRYSVTGAYDQDDSLSFLDLDGMEDE